MEPSRHPTTATWQLPPATRSVPPPGILRTNLRELAARPARFEHHLVVVGRLGGAQLEFATASEPLYFAHANISDEYALALPTGDALVDGFPLRTFLTDPETFDDVGRLNHRTGDMVLHPYGLLHWPGRLRPPYQPIDFGGHARRCALSFVYCASAPTSPTDRPLYVSAGRDADAKAYGPASVPFLLADTKTDPPGAVAKVGDTTLALEVRPKAIAPARGGLVLVLEAMPGGAHFASDLLHVSPGASLPGDGIERALVLSSDTASPEPPPASWEALPEPPFAVYEDGTLGELPVAIGGLRIEEESATTVAVHVNGQQGGGVPRYWLARMLFRLALHDFGLGYVETYGGFFFEGGATLRLGLRGKGSVAVPRTEMLRVAERLYRAVAPIGYEERL